MLFNHQRSGLETVDHFWGEEILGRSNLVFKAKHSTIAGEELFSCYGDDDWFEKKGIPLTNADSTPPEERLYTLEELHKDGQCLDWVRVSPSNISGLGVFAERSFAEGEVISLSPTLLMHRDLFVKNSTITSELANFCIARSDSDVTLLPLGRMAWINHQPLPQANVYIEWQEDRHLSSEYSVYDLMTMPFAPLALLYRASTSIEAGEELTIDCGFGDQEEVFGENRFIEAPANLYPQHWLITPPQPYAHSNKGTDEKDFTPASSGEL